MRRWASPRGWFDGCKSGKTTGARSEFFETVGRRFVYATLALTLALLLSLVLPTTGPVRGVAGADFLGLQSHNQIVAARRRRGRPR